MPIYKLRIIEASRPVLEHIKIVRAILEDQQKTKVIAADSPHSSEIGKIWCEGYATAMKDAVKASNSLLEEYY